MIRFYHSPIGPLTLIATQGRLLYCNWVTDDCLAKFNKFQKESLIQSTPQDNEIIELTISLLEDYFNGKTSSFDIPLELRGTPFQKNLWANIASIPYGETLTYKDLALKCGCPSAYRAVANACGANPIAIIIPCHRVTASNDRLGGYTGGLDKKTFLLDLESKME